MPWSIELRDGRYCVVKNGTTVPVPGGCHSSRADAIKHQRALYANESRVASIYDTLDALPIAEPLPEPVLAQAAQAAQEIRLVVSQDSPLSERMVETLEMIAGRLESGERLTEAMVASVRSGLAELPAPVVNVEHHVAVEPTPINVEAPNVTIQPTEVRVEPTPVEIHPTPVEIHPTPITVEAPHITVEAPNVEVHPEIVMPSERKRIVFERDWDGRITGAEVEEEVVE